MGWVVPQVNENKTGKKVAVIGSGPAGLQVLSNLQGLDIQLHYLRRTIELGVFSAMVYRTLKWKNITLIKE